MPGNQGMYVILSGSASPQLDNEPHDTSSLSRSRSGKSISDLMMDGKLQHIEMVRLFNLYSKWLLPLQFYREAYHCLSLLGLIPQTFLHCITPDESVIHLTKTFNLAISIF